MNYFRDRLSNDGRKWQLAFYPEKDRSLPYIIFPKSKEKFSARFTQDCEAHEISIFNEEGFKIIYDFEFNKKYTLNDRMSFNIEVENVSDIEKIFDAVLFVKIYMK